VTTQVVVLLAALVLVSGLVSNEERGWLIQRNQETLVRAARLVRRDLGLDASVQRDGGVEAANLMADAYGSRVTLIDSTGRVLGDSDVPADRLPSVENHAGRPEVHAALLGHEGFAIRHSRTIGVDLLYVAIPARIGPVAVVRLAEPQVVIARLNASLLGLSLGAAAVTLGLSLPLFYWLTGRHVRRIRRLEAVSSAIGRGRAARAPEQPPDELGRLGRALNEMSRELNARLDTIERERDQREQIIAHMRGGLALVDLEDAIVYCNPGLLVLGGAQAPPPGARIQEWLRAPEIDGLLRAARESGGTVEQDLRLWSPEPRLLHASASPVGPATEGAVLLVLHDLTELERANRIRQDFVANVSHELRTPLTSLRGYAETLLDGGLDDPEHREEFVRIIRDQAARLGAIVEDLLSLADLERPGARLRAEVFDLRALTQRLVQELEPRSTAAGLTLELEPGEETKVEADRARIEQVLANLLDNALKYTERGGVAVALGAEADRVWCEVRDSGPGIPAEDQARIFERFYRVDKARSRAQGGTGLGLSIVRHIIGLHGGEVSVRSRIGRGSVFRFEVPREFPRHSAESPGAQDLADPSHRVN